MNSAALSNRIAVFPKCFMDDLCVTHRLSLFAWTEMAATLHVDGLEMYPGFFLSFERAYLLQIRAALRHANLLMPMLCASPDFTQPALQDRHVEIERCKRMIELVDFFEAPAPRTCRMVSGQRRPGISEDEGVAMVIECLEQLLPYAEDHGGVLAQERRTPLSSPSARSPARVKPLSKVRMGGL